MLINPAKYSKIEYGHDHLTVELMDDSNLEYPDEYFDFAFSFSSVEHFGSHQAAAQAVKEMGRVTKSGGAVVVTTEVILNGVHHSEFFQPSELIEHLVDFTGLTLLEDNNFSISDRTLANPVDFSHPGLTYANPHLICKLGGIYWTSVCLVLVKKA